MVNAKRELRDGLLAARSPRCARRHRAQTQDQASEGTVQGRSWAAADANDLAPISSPSSLDVPPEALFRMTKPTEDVASADVMLFLCSS